MSDFLLMSATNFLLRAGRIGVVAIAVLIVALPAGLRAEVFALETQGTMPAVVGEISYYETVYEDTLS
ncbi:MAG: hypothetical protein ACR2P6_11120, partial [Gammaproteobacteria bacterium]